MNKSLFGFLPIMLGSLITTQSSSAQATNMSANVGVTSNYIWRGMTQSDKHFSVSAGLDYSHNSGFYLGGWAASVDFNDNTNAELDAYAGYQISLNDVNVDVGYLYYGYQGGDDLNFSELYLRTSYKNFTVGFSSLVDSQWGAEFAEMNYLEASYQVDLANEISINIHAGHWLLTDADNFQDFSIAISKAGFSLTASKINANSALDDTMLALSYSQSFEW
jgi:uncharacterized protein (TIGR02001 family)